MQTFDLPIKNKFAILALGAESAGNFSVYNKGKIYISADFGDLLIDKNYRKFKNELNKFLRKNKIKPKIVITDLHPLYKTTALGQEMAKKYKAKHIQVQHHTAHIFSCIGENMSIYNFQFTISKQIQNSAIGIVLDGTGYGTDGKIWGSEVFRLNVTRSTFHALRIGHLENQTMIGGDLAVKEPARMLISILDKVTRNKTQETSKAQITNHKNRIYQFVKKYYTRNQFELLYNQLQSGFNCQETSSTGRILDAVSILLGFCQNERNFKHEPVILLERNSTLPYRNLKPKIKKGEVYELDTTYLFKYLFKYIHRDKRRLAATAQLYIAEGLYKIAKAPAYRTGRQNTKNKSQIFLAGGIANNKIISDYLLSKGAIVNKEIPRGDAGISFGQIIYHLADPRD